MARKPAAKRDPELVYRALDGRLFAVVDLLVARPDLGPGRHTVVAAGTPIPAELANLPRRKRP